MTGARLVVRFEGEDHHFDWGAAVRIARDPGADVPVTDARVSREHLLVEPTVPGGWLLRDASSRGGTFVDGARVVEAPVPTSPDWLRVKLGDPSGPVVDLRQEPAEVLPQQLVDGGSAAPLVIGRDPAVDVPVDDLQVSRRHAELQVRPEGTLLRDLRSANGTFVNGRRVTSARLEVGDRVTIGATTLTWTGTRVAPAGASPRGDALVARHLRVATRAGTVLLDDVSLVVPEGGLVAVIGPSGAGKSTLLGALTGLRPAPSGSVAWRGQDLYRDYESLRSRIGLVPQDDALHPQLTVRRALEFAARLRLPQDVGRDEREQRVLAVLRDLDLEAQAGQRIDTLSGGQRKRVSIALELLTAPPLLFLDEPTSGLDPGLDQQVMAGLRRLADGGRAVVVVTHSVLNLDLCDRVLLLAPGGRSVYYGPPEQLLPFFGAATYADVFGRLQEPGWHTRFLHSPQHEDFLTAAPVSPSDGPPRRDPPPSTRPWQQAWTLTERSLAVVAADRALLAMLVSMPVVLALLARVVEGDSGLAYTGGAGSAQEIQQRLLVLVLAGSLMGAALSVRELVKERSVYRRERAVGLSPAAYLLSRAGVVSALVAVQAVAFTALALVGMPGPQDPLLLPGKAEIALAVAGVAVAIAMAGLAVSAAVRSADQTMPALVGLVMAQLVFCGALVPLAGRPVLEQVAWLAPARFGYAAAASSTGLPDGSDPLVEHDAGQYLLLLVVVACQALALLALTAWLLRRSIRRSGP